MAGDVHDFVNGGGGAYLRTGTALDLPAKPVTTLWAHYPTKAQLTKKVEALTPAWKWPAWWWTKNVGAWPSPAEWLSAAFDYDVAPFFQSFVVVRVERSANRVRLQPWGGWPSPESARTAAHRRTGQSAVSPPRRRRRAAVISTTV